jgi:hypothetical protein
VAVVVVLPVLLLLLLQLPVILLQQQTELALAPLVLLALPTHKHVVVCLTVRAMNVDALPVKVVDISETQTAPVACSTKNTHVLGRCCHV